MPSQTRSHLSIRHWIGFHWHPRHWFRRAETIDSSSPRTVLHGSFAVTQPLAGELADAGLLGTFDTAAALRGGGETPDG